MTRTGSQRCSVGGLGCRDVGPMETLNTHGVPTSLYQEAVSKLVVHNGGTPHTEALAKHWGCGNTRSASFFITNR